MTDWANMGGWEKFGTGMNIAGATMKDTSAGLRGEQGSALDDYMENVRKNEARVKKAKTFQKLSEISKEGGMGAVGEYLTDITDQDEMEGAKSWMALEKQKKDLSKPDTMSLLAAAISGDKNLLSSMINPQDSIKAGDEGSSIVGTGGLGGLEDAKISIGGVSGKLPKTESQRKRELKEKKEESSISIQQSADVDELKSLGEKFGQAARVVQAYRSMEGYGKAIDEIGLDAPVRQIISDASSFAKYVPDELQDKYTPIFNYRAQQEEAKIGALPILSGQARYVVSLAEAIDKTIPNIGMSKKNRQNLIAQSVRNQMSLIYAVQNGFFEAQNLSSIGINPNILEQGIPKDTKGIPADAQQLLSAIQLSSEQEASIEEAIDYSLGGGALEMGKWKKDEGKQETLPEVGGKFQGQTVVNIKRIE